MPSFNCRSNAIEALLESTRADYLSRLRNGHNEAATKVLNKLSEEAQQLFAQFSGNKFLPKIPIDWETDYRSLPVSPYFRSRGTMYAIVGQYRKEMSLTKSQVDQISAALTSFGTFESHDEYLKKSAQCLDVMFETLSNRQMLILAQLVSSSEFERDFASPFKRREVVAFLKLSKAETAEILELASNEQELRRAHISKVNATIFNELTDHVHSTSRQKLRELLDGVWELNVR